MRFVGYPIRSLLRRALPSPIVKRIRLIRTRKTERDREAERREAIERYGMFGPDALYEALRCTPGIREGGVLLVHSSFGHFFNFDGTSQQVLEVLDRLVGDEGTLLMPAHTHYDNEGPFVFDVRRSPAHTGIICELFRRRPGVIRSLHPTHSVCARGPLAHALTADHHKEIVSCGSLSPYAKLIDHGGEILGLGLPPAHTTFLHVVEDVDLDTYPRRTYLDREFEFTIIDEHGGQSKLYARKRDPELGSTLDLRRVAGHLTESAHRTFTVAGVPMFWARADVLFQEMTRLRDQGVILYA